MIERFVHCSQLSVLSFLGSSFVAVATPSAIATLSAPLASAISAASLSAGDVTFVTSDFGSVSGSSPATFWSRFSTWPLFQLSGISGSSVWLVVFSVFFLYVAAILYIDGGLLLSGILRSLNVGGGESSFGAMTFFNYKNGPLFRLFSVFSSKHQYNFYNKSM